METAFEMEIGNALALHQGTDAQQAAREFRERSS
jgi:hypothetical protein